MKFYKYALIFTILVSVYSLTACYKFLAFQEKAGIARAVYCRLTYFHLLPRPFSVIDFVIHFILWFTVSILIYRLYMRYLKGKLPF